MRRFWSSINNSSSVAVVDNVKLREVRKLPDFIYTWEVERRLAPFGPLPWTRLHMDHVRQWQQQHLKKNDVLSLIDLHLPISSSSSSSSSSPGHVHAFSAHVQSDGSFLPDAPTLQPSCRMFRVYGPHRFLRVHYHSPLPRHLRLSALSFAGRRWELLYADLARGAVVYFAVKGSQLAREVSVETVREWHLPLTDERNLQMTLAKYNARFSLGFSDSVATVAFDSVDRVADVVSDGTVMSDGCAAMPLWAMQQIATAAELPALPSVVQGRIGACKGVWYLDPAAQKPQVRPSQEKAHLPHPTLEQRRFELVEWSRDRGPASLNYQFIHVLLHLQVPMEAFANILREHAARLHSDIASRPHHFLRHIGVASDAQAQQMLAAGFDPATTPFLRRLLNMAAASHFSRLSERMRIPVDKSRWLLLVADPTGTLQFGQAYAHPSSLPGPLKGRVIVARNPCHLPSDVQVMECVAEPRLSHIRDALVLPVNGPYPPAQLLSGGDHDGDLAFVSWDTRLLPPPGCPERMPPPELPSNPGTPEASPLPGAARTLKSMNLDQLALAERHAQISSALIDMFRAYTPTLGVLTNIHAAWTEKDGVASPNAIKAAWLCREAVDGPKAGVKVKIPKALTTAGMLSKEQVLPVLRDECTFLQKSFQESTGLGPSQDSDMVLNFSKDEFAYAQREYARWKQEVHEALGNGSELEPLKAGFRKRFLSGLTSNNDHRLQRASAYYVVGSESSSNSFAFSCCFRELLRIKADAVERRRDPNNIAISSVTT